MQALQGRMEDRARSVLQESTKQPQVPTLAVIAMRVHTRVKERINAMFVQKDHGVIQAMTFASAQQGTRELIQTNAHCVRRENTKIQWTLGIVLIASKASTQTIWVIGACLVQRLSVRKIVSTL